MKDGVSEAIAKIKDDAIKQSDRQSVSKFKSEGHHNKDLRGEPEAENDGRIGRDGEVSGTDPNVPPVAPGLSLNDVTQVFRQKYLAVLVGAIIGLALAAAILARSTPIYSVSAKVVVNRHDPGELVNTDSGSATFIATQAEVMSSLGIVARAVESLPRPDFLDPDADAVAEAHKAINASAITRTRVIALAYMGPDGEYGAALLKAMVDAYADEMRDTNRAGQAQALATKTAELDALLREIANQEAQITELRAANDVIGTADEASAAQSERLRDLTDQLTQLRSRRIDLESRLAAGGTAGPNAVDPGRESLQQDLRLAEAELARVSRTLTAAHPTVVAARSNVEILREQLAASDRFVLADQIAEAVRNEAELTALVSQSRNRLEAIESHRQVENELLAKLAQNRSQAETWRNELSELRMGAQMAEQGNVGVSARFTDVPVAPESPVWPKPKFVLSTGLALGAFGGFLLGLVLVRRRKV